MRRAARFAGLGGAALAIALGSLGCSTYVSTATSGWTERLIEKREIVRAKGREQSGPGEAIVRGLHLGGEPTLEIACEGPAGLAAEVAVRRVPERVRRRARATLVVKNSLNENILVYGLGIAVLAPVWVPLQYQVRAHGAAAGAAGGPPGIRTVKVGENDCVVEVAEERDPDLDESRAAVETREEILDPERGPLRGEPVEVRAGRTVLTFRTDENGSVAIPLRALLGAVEGGETFEVVVGPGTAQARATRLSLAGAVPPERLAEAVEALFAPPVPAAPPPAGTPPARAAAVPEEARAALASAEDALAKAGPGALDEACRLAAAAAARAPAWAAAHLALATLEHEAGRLAAALSSLASARDLAPRGGETDAGIGALFTMWASQWPVEVVRCRSGKLGERDLEAVRDRLAGAAPPLPPADLEALAAARGLEVETATFGSRALPIPPLFAPGAPSDLLRDGRGDLFFYRFAPR